MKFEYSDFSSILLLSVLLLAPFSLSFAHTITLDAAVKQVKESDSGKIISAKTEVNEQDKHHIIRVLTPEGRIIPITIDAQQHRHTP